MYLQKWFINLFSLIFSIIYLSLLVSLQSYINNIQRVLGQNNIAPYLFDGLMVKGAQASSV